MLSAPPRARAALVPPGVRRGAAILVAACAVVLAVLAVHYSGQAHPGRLDSAVIRALPRALTAHQRLLSALADLVPPLAAAVSLVLAGTGLARRRWDVAVLAVAGPGLTTLLTEGAKHLVGRTIHGGLALPSGHTAAATSAVLVLGIVALGRARAHPRLAAAAVLGAATVAAAVAGLVMVALGAHYPTDVLAGWCTAVAVTLAVALALDSVPR